MFSQVILVFVHREIFGKNSDCDMDCLAGRAFGSPTATWIILLGGGTI